MRVLRSNGCIEASWLTEHHIGCTYTDGFTEHSNPFGVMSRCDVVTTCLRTCGKHRVLTADGATAARFLRPSIVLYAIIASVHGTTVWLTPRQHSMLTVGPQRLVC